jgi:hypothetical protein
MLLAAGIVEIDIRIQTRHFDLFAFGNGIVKNAKLLC